FTMNLQCIIFDMDGTLTQTNQLIYDSFNYIAEKYRSRRYSVPEITAMFGPPEEAALLSIIGPDELEQVMEDYLRFYRAHHARLARLYPGIEGVLRYLKQSGVRLAGFTGKGIHTTTISMEEFGIKNYFDVVVTGNDVVNHKPSAEGIRKILSHFGLRPDEALMVGDAVSDVKAAHEAGVKIAAVLWDSYGKEQVFQMKTDFVFFEVGEFEQWLKSILNPKQ
ncbi:MAG: HAD-IA family hydrolase, partial [Ignavibacteriales bacterium]|nr:HAD-IA family hydrolase [Ignavibacteriales bacterium]